MKKLMFLIGVTLLLPSCSDLNRKLGLPDDNLAEEVIEDVIKEELGGDVDLTPESPEKK